MSLKAKEPPEPECTSTTENIVVPGLTLIENFIHPDEESAILGQFDSDAKWECGINRRVQHYGYRFNYQTLQLDASIDLPTIPPSLIELLQQKIENFNSTSQEVQSHLHSVNQLTINDYQPGQGIASHIDTECCFGPVIFILSLGSGITMTFTESPEGSPIKNGILLPRHSQKLGCDSNNHVSTSQQSALKIKGYVRKHVYLPPRSLLIMQDDARYKWAHGIAPRKRDKVNGVIQPRGRRISLTLRQGIVSPVNTTSTIFNEVTNMSTCDAHSSLRSTEEEKEHVFNVYDEIAMHWHHTRGIRKVYWQKVKDFIESLPTGAFVADVGCGDGKYFDVNKNIFVMGCDRSLGLLQVSNSKSHEVFCCDAVALPLLSNFFDAAICIAVLHHLASEERRLSVIREIIRILKPGASCMIQAWALEQDPSSRRIFEDQDVLVPWKLQKHFANSKEYCSEENKKSTLPDDYSKSSCSHAVEDAKGNIVFQRYCHVYKEGELEELCSRIDNCRVIESGFDKSNWFIIVSKTCR